MWQFSGTENLCSSEHSKLCFGAPEMFSASQNYLSTSYPPKSGGYDVFSCKYIRSIHKFYTPNNHINSPNSHSLIIKITIYAIKKLLQKDTVSHIITKFAVYANKMCK